MGFSPEDDVRRFRTHLMVHDDVWVAVQGDGQLGLLAVREGFVDQLFVDPPMQNRGVGSALLDKAKALMPEGLTLFTHQRNRRARSFYEARDFKALALGISPEPENEPDVKYRWRP